MSDILTVSIIGVGARGGEAYGKIMLGMPQKFRIVALCDRDEGKLNKYKKLFDIPDENAFSNDDEFFKEKRSDILLIATGDTEHVSVAKRAIPMGYKILLEKPISDQLDELVELRGLAENHHAFVMVCHVLRYTWANRTIMEVIRSGRLGRLIHIDHTEQICFWHFAHSYVRGNWRNTKVAAPMIMAKSCHDLDLLQQYAGSKCDSLSSVGELTWFKAENAPHGAAERCLDCQYQDTCPYSAKLKYLVWRKRETPDWARGWPYSVLTVDEPTDENLEAALKSGPYGRCVFRCDNNVVDHQTVTAMFENDVTATFNVTAFTKNMGRITKLHFSEGELIYEEEKGMVIEKPFAGEDVVHQNDINDNLGHGGGDYGILNTLYNVLTKDEAEADTSLENSIESHLMAIAAEDSRVNGGKVVFLKNYR